MDSIIKKKIPIIGAGVVVVVLIATIIVLHFRPYDYSNNKDLSTWYIQDQNTKGENTSSTGSFPIAYLAFARSNFENQEELFNLYKPYLLAGDYISTISISPPNPAQNLDQLPFSSDKIKGVTYFSLDEIRENAEMLKQKGVGFIGYDLESEGSPASDQSDPVASMRESYKIVHQHGLKFLAVPGYPFDTNAYISQYAPYADIYVIQAQGNESKPSVYQSSVKSQIEILKAVNPDIRIITELSTNKGTVLDMEKSFSMVAQYVDGVTVWQESVNDLSKVKRFLEWYNQNYRQ